VFYVPANTV